MAQHRRDRCGVDSWEMSLRQLALSRRCCQLDYSSRHMRRTVPGLHRLLYLRRRLGVDPRPFSPIPLRPSFHRIAAEISALERALVEHPSGINQDLERRARLRGMLPK